MGLNPLTNYLDDLLENVFYATKIFQVKMNPTYIQSN